MFPTLNITLHSTYQCTCMMRFIMIKVRGAGPPYKRADEAD